VLERVPEPHHVHVLHRSFPLTRQQTLETR
jgi:hypothetical protein